MLIFETVPIFGESDCFFFVRQKPCLGPKGSSFTSAVVLDCASKNWEARNNSHHLRWLFRAFLRASVTEMIHCLFF